MGRPLAKSHRLVEMEGWRRRANRLTSFTGRRRARRSPDASRRRRIGGVIGVLVGIGVLLPSPDSRGGTMAATVVTPIKQARLHATAGPNAKGRAVLELYPRHAEIELDLHGFRRRPDRAFIVWLKDARGRGHIGGAFPSGFLSEEDGSTVVPGGDPQSQRTARLAHQIEITSMKRARAIDLLRRLHSDGWPGGVRTRGGSVVRGSAHRCPAAGCWVL